MKKESRGERILLAEDDPDLREGLVRTLERSGFEVVAFEGGDDLAAYLEPAMGGGAPPPASAIVSDVRLPGLTGTEVWQGLRAIGWKLPILLITADRSVSRAKELAKLPGSELLFKPFDPQELIERLRALIGGATPAH